MMYNFLLYEYVHVDVADEVMIKNVVEEALNLNDDTSH